MKHIALLTKNFETAEDYLNSIYGKGVAVRASWHTYRSGDAEHQIITPETPVTCLKGRYFDALVCLNQFEGQDGVSEYLTGAMRGWDTKASELERLQQQVTEIQRKIIELAGG